MNLSEAFRYQNVLSGWVRDVEACLLNEKYMMKTVVERKRSSAVSSAQDDVEEISPERIVNLPNNILISFYLDAIDEKINLAVAIEDAKMDSKDGGHIDATIQANRLRRRTVDTLRRMSLMCDHTEERLDTDYYIAPDGEQKVYLYPTVVHKELDFDRENVRSRAKQLMFICEQSSVGIEKELRNRNVRFRPKFDSKSSFAEALEEYYLSMLPKTEDEKKERK